MQVLQILAFLDLSQNVLSKEQRKFTMVLLRQSSYQKLLAYVREPIKSLTL